ncbi:MAG: hypothetical protein JXN62_06665 [Bacteroidales bacterium]|nr:hypothetical protein [Bacteroidales bacterium]
MGLKEIFNISRGTKAILAISASVSFIAVLFAFFYYRSINRSEDPRIRAARELLSEYENISGRVHTSGAFALLDSALTIFNSLPDYRSSFEKGVIYNNKCSSLLLTAIYDSTISEAEKNILLGLSMEFCDSSILLYKRWLREWETLSPEEIAYRLTPFMKEEDPDFKGLNFTSVFSRRVKNITIAQVETPRRLSVSYTNKATIFRHIMEPDSSITYYRMALDLWKDNRTAKSNMSVLMGGKPLKPKLIESLFPPDKNVK